MADKRMKWVKKINKIEFLKNLNKNSKKFPNFLLPTVQSATIQLLYRSTL